MWSKSGGEPDTKLIWAACCLCFFAFLRAEELTVPSGSSYDPSVHSSVGDIAIDHSSRPSFMRVTIKQSKLIRSRRELTFLLEGLAPIFVRWQLYLIICKQEEPPRVHFFALRTGAPSRDSVSSSWCAALTRGRVLTSQSTVSIASESELRRPQRPKGWRIAS